MLALLCAVMFQTFAWSTDMPELLTRMEGTVTALRLTDLHMGPMRFNISRDVVVTLHKEGGKRLSIKELAGVGRIEKARIFLNGGTVMKIVVLEMAQ
jgi:hypothetical protein